MADRLTFEVDVPARPSAALDSILREEDGGQALILDVEGEGDLFIRLQSWDESRSHEAFAKLLGRRIRITL